MLGILPKEGQAPNGKYSDLINFPMAGHFYFHLPQVADKNLPQSMDVAGEYWLYYEVVGSFKRTGT